MKFARRVAPASLVRAALYAGCLLALGAVPAAAQRQMEHLGRGVVAVRSGATQAHIGWRWLGNDPDDLAFNVYRVTGGVTNRLNPQPLANRTDFADTPNLAVANTYFVRTVLGGVEVPDVWANPLSPAAFTVPANAAVPRDHQNNAAPYLSIPLQVPPGGVTPDGVAYTYSPNDASVGDLDGDGELEIVLKWDPSNSRDNAHSGHTGNVLLDAYRLDGALLWRIDLGVNIRAGAHYTQFMVYDLDGDGRAEVACKTAPGTRDGLGNHVILPGDDPNADFRNSSGRILAGPEYLTIFDGLTGAALATTNYVPPRGTVSAWGDSHGNRVDRFLAAVAYLDGVRPSLVMCRGVYTRVVLAAWDWRDGRLARRWVFDSNTPGNGAFAGQGNHQLSVADVDGDGRDEIVYGAAVIDDNGAGLHTTGLGHGDAMHVSDMDPDRPGLEVWGVHETGSFAGGGGFRDARAGAVIFGVSSTGDTGRGLAAHMDAAHRGYQMWSSASAGTLNRFGVHISPNRPSINFAVWWDADWQRELLDNAGSGGAATTLDKWTGSGVTRILSPWSVDGAVNNNGTKSNPCLSGDLLGDWREEILLRSSDRTRLMLFLPVTPATNRFRTFLHDPTYRVALAWQNVAYNQPPHPGFYVGAGMNAPPEPLFTDAPRAWRGGVAGNVWNTTATNWLVNNLWTNTVHTNFAAGQSVLFDLRGGASPVVTLAGALAPARVKVHSPASFTFTGAGSLAGAMRLVKAGTGALTLNTTNSFTGATEVSEGALLVNGALLSSPVRVRPGVWLNSRLGGSGLLGGGAVIERGCLLAPGDTNAAATLTVSNSLVIAGPARLLFDLSDDPTGVLRSNDRLRVLGNLTLSGASDLELTALNGALGAGSYPLIEHTGTLTGGPANLRLSPLWTNAAHLAFSPGLVTLVVTGGAGPPGARELVWRGGANSNAWDTAATANWHDGASTTIFRAGDLVTFDDIGGTNRIVNLTGILQPSIVRVLSSHNYIFTGAGSLAGTNGLVKSGAGMLTLATVNTYSGGTRLTNGILALSGPAPGSLTANNYALGSGPVTFLGGTLQMYGFGLGDNDATYGAMTNDLVVPAGQAGTLRTGPRQTVSSRVSGGGALNLHVEFVRGEITGDWTGFTGRLAVSNTTGTPPSSAHDDFRAGNARGFPAARVFLGPNVSMYSRAASGSVIPVGELAAHPEARLVAGGGTGLGAQFPVTWRVGALNTSATNAAAVSGATSLVKEGAGAWTLTGTNTHSGSNHVSAGALFINGNQSSAFGPLTVGPGGTLGGVGAIGNPAVISGRLAPGAPGLGALTFGGNVTLAPGATLQMDISKVPFQHDRLVAGGTLHCAGTLQVGLLGPDAPTAGDHFPLLSATNITGGFAAFDLPELAPGLAWNTSRLLTEGRLWVVRTEPPSFTTLAVAGGQLQMSGAGGTPGWEFRVLTATNAAAPLAQWTAIATNQFDAAGAFHFSAPVAPDMPERYFRLWAP